MSILYSSIACSCQCKGIEFVVSSAQNSIIMFMLFHNANSGYVKCSMKLRIYLYTPKNLHRKKHVIPIHTIIICHN